MTAKIGSVEYILLEGRYSLIGNSGSPAARTSGPQLPIKSQATYQSLRLLSAALSLSIGRLFVVAVKCVSPHLYSGGNRARGLDQALNTAYNMGMMVNSGRDLVLK